MRNSFRERLAHLRASCVPFYGLGAGAFHSVIIRPALGFCLVPRPRAQRWDPEGTRTEEHRHRERLAAVLAPAQAGGSGLVEGSKSDAMPEKTRARQGLAGLPRSGATIIEDLCSLVRQDRGLYAIWTVTLPVEVAEALDLVENGAQRFGDTIRRRFGEMLRRACQREQPWCRLPVPDHFWFVVEPQKSGRPHWHFVFRCRGRFGRPWLLSTGRLDDVIRNACRTVAGLELTCQSAGNVQALRKDPGSYLSSYLKKEASRNAPAVVLGHGWSLNLVPLRWWGCSVSARAFLNQYRFELPSVAVGWLSKQWPSLAAIGALDARLWTPEAEGAPTVVVGRFYGIDGLERVVSHLFGLAERAYDLGRTFGIT